MISTTITKKNFEMDFIEHGKDKIQDAEEQLEAVKSKYESQMAHYIKTLDNNQLADMLWSDCNTTDAQQLICEALARLLRKL